MGSNLERDEAVDLSKSLLVEGNHLNPNKPEVPAWPHISRVSKGDNLGERTPDKRKTV